MAWVKGQSGNPGGRPKAEREVVELARDASARAIGRLVELIENENPRVSIQAANSVLDRAFGKPTQPLANDPENPVNPPPSVDNLAKLTAHERAQLRTILGKATRRSSGDSPGA